MSRSSVLPTDVGYAFYKKNQRAFYKKKLVITLDGKPMSRVITADEEQGYILRFKTSENGAPFIDPNDRTRAATEELHGVVKIEEAP
jgi:hypothetical protein